MGGNLGVNTAVIEYGNGNVVTSSSAVVTETITGPGGYSQVVTAMAVNGVATFNLIALPLTTAGTYTVTTTSPGLVPAVSTVLVTGAAAKLATVGIPATVALGGNLGTNTAMIEDTNGNVVTGSSAVVTETITGPGGYSQVVTATAVNGVATFNLSALTLTTAGAYTVTTSSPGLVSSVATVTVTASGPAGTQLVPGPLPSTVAAGGNLGSETATIEDANGNVVTSSNAIVTLTITGPGNYSQMVTATAVNGVATFDLSGLAFTTPGTYTVTISSPGLSTSTSTFTVSAAAQDFTLGVTSGTGGAATQLVLPGGAATYQLTLAPSNNTFPQAITLSATGLPAGATYSFSPATVTPGATSVGTTLVIQTAKSTTAALQPSGSSTGLGAIALGLLLLPLAGSRRLRAAARSMPRASLGLALALLSLGALAGLSGCGAGGLFNQPQQSYTITVTGTSGALSHSTTVTLTVQ